MATSSDKDDRSDNESSEDDAAEAGDKTPEQETAAEPTGGATEGTVGRKLGASTADPSDKGEAIGKPGKTAGTARPVRPGAPKRVTGKSTRARGAPPVNAAVMRPKGGSLGKSLVLFVIVVGGLGLGFALLGQDKGGGGRVAPNWKVGQTVDVEITLIKNDRNELVCASPEEVAGRHCAYEGAQKRWSKPDDGDDKKLLKPYTTTNGAELLAAGLWSEPALSGTLPATRFSVKCKYQIEGTVKKPAIRWGSDKPFYDSPTDWHAGVVTGCTLLP